MFRMSNLAYNISDGTLLSEATTTVYTTATVIFVALLLPFASVCLFVHWREKSDTRLIGVSVMFLSFAIGVFVLLLNVTIANKPEMFRTGSVCYAAEVVKLLLLSAYLFQQMIHVILFALYQMFPMRAPVLFTDRRQCVILLVMWLLPGTVYVIAAFSGNIMILNNSAIQACSISKLPREITFLFILGFLLPYVLVHSIAGAFIGHKMCKKSKHVAVVRPIEHDKISRRQNVKKCASLALLLVIGHMDYITLLAIPAYAGISSLTVSDDVTEITELVWSSVAFSAAPSKIIAFVLARGVSREKIKRVILKIFRRI